MDCCCTTTNSICVFAMIFFSRMNRERQHSHFMILICLALLFKLLEFILMMKLKTEPRFVEICCIYCLKDYATNIAIWTSNFLNFVTLRLKVTKFKTYLFTLFHDLFVTYLTVVSKNDKFLANYLKHNFRYFVLSQKEKENPMVASIIVASHFHCNA